MGEYDEQLASIHRKRNKVCDAMMRFSNNVQMWMNWHRMGLESDSEFVDDIREELKELHWLMDRIMKGED